jgi:uncharacterized protein YndB with AHSA1/START domain
MPTDTIELSRILPATPERIYAAWLDAAEHTAMTGSPATVASAQVGGRFTAWDGYIDGSHLALEPGVRILQSWRSDDFPADALDSLLEVRLEPAEEGTRVTLRHGDLPEGHGPALLEGWVEFYFVPMGRYFGKPAKKAKKARGAARRKGRPGAKKLAVRKGRPGRRKVAAREGGRKAATKAKGAHEATKRSGAAKRPAAKKAEARQGGRR